MLERARANITYCTTCDVYRTKSVRGAQDTKTRHHSFLQWRVLGVLCDCYRALSKRGVTCSRKRVRKFNRDNNRIRVDDVITGSNSDVLALELDRAVRGKFRAIFDLSRKCFCDSTRAINSVVERDGDVHFLDDGDDEVFCVHGVRSLWLACAFRLYSQYDISANKSANWARLCW